MVELLQWGYGEMSKCHGIIFLPPSTPLPPISGCINCVRCRLSSSIYDLFLPLPTHSPFYSSSYPSYTSSCTSVYLFSSPSYISYLSSSYTSLYYSSSPSYKSLFLIYEHDPNN